VVSTLGLEVTSIIHSALVSESGLPLALSTTGTEGLLDNLASGGEELESAFEVGLVLSAHSTVSVLTKGVVTNAESTLVSERARNFTLKLVRGDSDDTGVVN